MALGRDSNAWDYADSTTPDLTDFPNESEGVCCLQSLDGSEEFPKVILELQLIPKARDSWGVTIFLLGCLTGWPRTISHQY